MGGSATGSVAAGSAIWRAAGLALLLAVIVALVYREAPGNQFHFDDYHNIVDYGPVRMAQPSAAALWEAFTNPRLTHRNVASLTFAIDWWRGGGQPRAFLQTNVLLHILAALAVFVFARQVLLRLKPDDPGIVLLAAFAAALLWAVHPLNSQAVNLIVQRMTILATLFVLLSLSCYLAGRSAETPRAIALFAAAGLFAVLAGLSKENAWILPVLVLAAEYGVVRHGKALMLNRMDTLLLSLPFIAAALVVLDLASGNGPISRNFLSGYEIRSFTMEERLLTQPRVVFFYLSLVFWPLAGRFSLEHDFAVSTSLTSPPATIFALLGGALILLAALYLFLRPKTRLTGFLLLWPAMTLVIESSFIPLEMVFEHRMYLPMVGLALLAGAAWIAVHDYRPAYSPAFAAVVAVVALGLTLSTAKRTELWEEPLLLNEDAVKKAPNSSRAWSNLGMYRYLGGDQAGAIAALEKAIELSGGREMKALEHLGVIQLDLGNLERAEALVGRAYRMQWKSPEPSLLNHMGEVELARERYASAAAFFDRAIRIAPWKSAYYWNIALAYEGLGRCSLALQYWRDYLRLEPDPGSRHEVERHIEANYGAGETGCGKAPRQE
jgi:tetratricopeptide (TPR) repeat protein